MELIAIAAAALVVCLAITLGAVYLGVRVARRAWRDGGRSRSGGRSRAPGDGDDEV